MCFPFYNKNFLFWLKPMASSNFLTRRASFKYKNFNNKINRRLEKSLTWNRSWNKWKKKWIMLTKYKTITNIELLSWKRNWRLRMSSRNSQSKIRWNTYLIYDICMPIFSCFIYILFIKLFYTYIEHESNI